MREIGRIHKVGILKVNRKEICGGLGAKTPGKFLTFALN